ncbi:MAG: glycosyltransferase family 2 protein [Terriglobia bacterium]
MVEPEFTWVVIPAYNEAQSVGAVVASLRAEGYRVVVVDDGSTDETAEIARSAGAIVLRHDLNLGAGGALQTGITFSLESGARFICSFDADGQHCTGDIAKMLNCLLSRNVDVVLGSRFLGSAVGMPQSRKILLKAAALFTRFHSGQSFSDAQNGLRVMTGQAAARLHLTQMRFAHCSEIVDEIVRLKLRWCEFPVTVVYTNYSKSKGQSNLGAIRILVDLLVGRVLR